jgi:hypothetical protein
VTSNKSSKIQPWFNPGLASVFVQSSVIGKIVFVVNSVHKIVDAVGAVRVPVVELQTDQEGI